MIKVERITRLTKLSGGLDAMPQLNNFLAQIQAAGALVIQVQVLHDSSLEVAYVTYDDKK